MALKLWKKGNILAGVDTVNNETVRINGTFAFYSIDVENEVVTVGELTNEHKTISAYAVDIQDEAGTPIGTLAQVDDYLSTITNFKAAVGNPALTDVLTVGNQTGGVNIEVTEGDVIRFLNGAFGLGLNVDPLTADRVLSLPDKSGTLALTSDIPDSQSLADILGIGNSTGANNILTSDGQVIQAVNDLGQLNLRFDGWNPDDVMLSVDAGGWFNEAYLLLSNQNTELSNKSGNIKIQTDKDDYEKQLQYLSSNHWLQVEEYGANTFEVPANARFLLGEILTANNTFPALGDRVVFNPTAGGVKLYPVVISSRLITVLEDLRNISVNASVDVTVTSSDVSVNAVNGGTAKTPFTNYVEKIGILKNSVDAFELIVDRTTLTADRTQTHQDKSGTIALTSDLNDYILSTEKGSANGVAPLNGSSKIDASYLPAYVDDVIEVTNFASLPVTGEAGKIYITLDDNKIYRWATSVYVEISDTLSATEVKSLYESNANTNVFTDAQVSEVSANTLKVTNANHSGEVSGSGALTVQPLAVSNKTLKTTLLGTEEVLINDGGTLKKTTATDIVALAGGGGSVWVEEKTNIASTSSGTWVTRALGGGYANKQIKVVTSVTANTSAVVGVRNGVSSLDLAFAHGRGSNYFEVLADGSGNIKIKSDDIAILFYVIGTK